VDIRRYSIKLAALAVLFASVTNAHAHVHLCFDGQEPPATIHGSHDSGVAHHGDEQGNHDDLDIDLRDEGVAKSFKPDLPAVTAAYFFVLPATAYVDEPPIPEPGSPRGPDPPHTRPLLRAPPLTLP
jgi:hypothetical protein